MFLHHKFEYLLNLEIHRGRNNVIPFIDFSAIFYLTYGKGQLIFSKKIEDINYSSFIRYKVTKS